MEPRNEDPLESLVADCLAAIEGDDTRTIQQAVDELCHGPPEQRAALQRRIERLRDLGLLDGPKLQVATPEVAGYALRSCLGSGGMGEVWLAMQQEPVRRPVALKVIRADRRSTRVLQRFASERQALARMSHPGVAQVYDAGTTASGEPFFAMEFVDGEAIDRACDRRSLDFRQRIELMAKVCDAVQHAHERGVLHRDLKPHNILVTEIDGALQPKVIDFGLAKALEGDISNEVLQTIAGQVLGTPQYMAPEQADPGVQDVDVRVDVYALGAVLFEILTGSLLIDVPNGALLEVVEHIRNRERPTPSSRLRVLGNTAEGEAERSWLRSLASQCRGDLDRICGRATEVDPQLRYRSVAELGADLRAFLEDRPISATRPTTIYRLRKFAKRRRGTFATAVVVLLTAAVGSGFALHYQVQARRSLTWLDRLAEGEQLNQLEQSLERLGPLGPDGLIGLETWLTEADRLVDQRPEVRAILGEIRGKAGDPEAADVRARRYEQGRFLVLDESLTELLSKLDELATDRDEVARWTAFARTVPEPKGGPDRELWMEAIESIADPESCPEYRGLRIAAQTGLAPLRRNPRTGLWEFYVLWPGIEPPTIDSDGHVVITEQSPPIMVLIPGGRFWMGSETEEGRPYFDEFADNFEGPRHEVTLDPFFMGKHELTQAQWRLLTGETPSLFTEDYGKQPGRRLEDPIDSRNPVERVSWIEGDLWARRMGLALATEAQWEYAARAGTDTPWWTGRYRESLHEPAAGNLSDERAERDKKYAAFEAGLDDGFLLHAPVDLGRANPFGLFGMIGNVWEWVRDDSHPYDTVEPRPGDGFRSPAEDRSDGPGDLKVIRGGGFDVTARHARHAKRLTKAPGDRSPGIGLRLSRSLQPYHN